MMDIDFQSPPFSWTCPFCHSMTTINNDDTSMYRHELNIKTKYGYKLLFSYFIVCPNRECKEYSLVLEIYSNDWSKTRGSRTPKFEQQITVIPPFTSKLFPEYIPQPIRDDYYEACKIRDLSPKASATLARRCIQGMIRDFWDIRKSRLIDEIIELKEKVDYATWEAIDAVRKVGNIGAHMEQDVNVVINIDPGEAFLLIGLVEYLIEDWYIARHERELRLQRIVEMQKNKEAGKSSK